MTERDHGRVVRIASLDDDISLDVLLLSGDSALAEMHRLKLELDGYRVTTFRRFQDWSPPRVGYRPDLILFDLSGGDERLRVHRILKGVPMLIVSS